MKVGEYEIVAEIGRGGMGVVYRAKDPGLGRMVALKVAFHEALPGEKALRRFKQECKAIGELTHPNIVRAYHAGIADGGQAFLAMELLDGEDLRKLVRRDGPRSVVEACGWIRQAALGLQHAHEWKRVHRDLKPQNLMLTKDGVVKVLDLGIAKVVSDVQSEEALTTSPMGTPEFMAPEQAVNTRTADIRADIYSLGCTLYYLLTGEAPFGSRPKMALMEIIDAHREKEIPEITGRDDIPDELRDILRRLLAKDPDRRPSEPRELAEALLPFTGPPSPGNAVPSPGESPRARPSRRVSAIVAVLLLALLAGTAWKQVKDRTAPAAGASELESHRRQFFAGEVATPVRPEIRRLLALVYETVLPGGAPDVSIEVESRQAGRAPESPLRNGDRLSSGDDYHLTATAREPCHLYVFQIDSRGKVDWVFPRGESRPFSSGANPLSAGETVRIPEGLTSRGTPEAFFLDESTGTEHLYAVATLSAWPELEFALKTAIRTNRDAGRITEPFGLRDRGVGGVRAEEDPEGVLVLERWFRHVAP